jgi:hypothetical protein
MIGWPHLLPADTKVREARSLEARSLEARALEARASCGRDDCVKTRLILQVSQQNTGEHVPELPSA